MEFVRKYWRRLAPALPLLSIVWASFQPISPRGQQALVFFTLAWFYTFVLLEIFLR
ncbi:MAG: hypothetical protein N2117_13745 [Anaerolineales bacterium]|nr:hypothetical protein [Anaerolineales bacterium]MCX7756288.1 hypothetical protein [Anaerolineales bacterium]MDW8276630.1 hypothetical protein [Anaerolineales bacterium]